jgi:hypothetical protein
VGVVSTAASLFPDLEGHWYAVSRVDARARALFRRHYSSYKNAAAHRTSQEFIGPGETLVLITTDSLAMFAWQRCTVPRLDGQEGVCCVVFRNEGPVLSSDLIREACEMAWRRWPGKRLFTYVWDDKVASVNPGYCFKRAGWRACGRNTDGRLTILEIFPLEVSS